MKKILGKLEEDPPPSAALVRELILVIPPILEKLEDDAPLLPL
jgi:hypothetical protein